MKARDYILTGFLLLSIGLTLGTLFSLYLLDETITPLAEVEVTQVQKSDDPFFSDESLENVGAPFLFKKIADAVTPTVVYIETIVPLEDEGVSDAERMLWDRVVPRRARTVGSGVIISTDGYILTNNHVIEDAIRNGIKVYLSDKREFPAQIVGRDPATDLAVIKVPAVNLPAITVGNSDRVGVGEWVVAVGNPFRLRSTVTAGIISALGRDVQIINDQRGIESFIQTDAAINKGNSGGALVNTSGQLIGINTAIASQSGSYQGYGFAIPSNLALKVATDMIEFGKVKRAYLGVYIASVDFNRSKELGLTTVKGVEIIRLNEDGAAMEHGLQVGDVVLEVNREPVNESNELQEKVAVLRPGDFVTLTVFRDGNQFDAEVRLKESVQEEDPLAELPQEELDVDEIPVPEDDEGPGYDLYAFNSGFKVESKKVEDQRGVYQFYVFDVTKYSEAWNRGLKTGQEILSVNGKAIGDIDDLRDLIRDAFEADNSVTLKVRNDDDVIGFVQLKQ